MRIQQERELVRLAQAGDRQALAALYRAYVQAIYRYAWLRTSDAQTAEDLTAEVFLRAVEGLPGYSDRGLPFGAWLFRIARDRVADHHRRAARRPFEPLNDDQPDDEIDLAAGLAAADDVRALRVALRRLTDEQRAIIQLRFMENYSLAQAAALMGRSVNAVKALQHRALAALGRWLDRGG